MTVLSKFQKFLSLSIAWRVTVFVFQWCIYNVHSNVGISVLKIHPCWLWPIMLLSFYPIKTLQLSISLQLCPWTPTFGIL